MNRVKWVLFACAAVLFVAAIIGMFAKSNPSWVEPVQEAGWVVVVLLFVVDYLLDRGPAGEGAAYTTPEKAAWGFAAAAIACFLVAIVAGIAADTRGYWVEAVETAGVLCAVVLILIVVTVRRGRVREETL